MRNFSPKLSLAVPMYNEEEVVNVFYERIKKIIDELDSISDYEIVVVNDGSIDGTLETLKTLKQIDPKIKIVNFSRNFGKEVALTAALDYTTGDIVVPIDADLQDPPELIKEFIKKWKDEEYDVVYGIRSKREGEGFLKRYTAHAFYRLINKMTTIPIPIDTGDFRLMDRSVVDALKSIHETHRFMKGIFAWVGFKQTGIFYVREKRIAGNTKWNYLKLINLAIEGITSFSYIPLRIASYIGILTSFIAFLYASFIFVKTLIFGNEVDGYPSMIIAVLFLGGVQLLALGVIGEYLGRIYNEVKKRPLYIVKEVI